MAVTNFSRPRGRFESAEVPEIRLASMHQYGSAFVLNQEDYEFRRFGLAGVSPNDVNIGGTFIEGLARCQSDFLSALYLHHDGAFEHINKRMCVVAMYWVRATRRILLVL
jgi:hypothetical protein